MRILSSCWDYSICGTWSDVLFWYGGSTDPQSPNLSGPIRELHLFVVTLLILLSFASSVARKAPKWPSLRGCVSKWALQPRTYCNSAYRINYVSLRRVKGCLRGNLEKYRGIIIRGLFIWTNTVQTAFGWQRAILSSGVSFFGGIFQGWTFKWKRYGKSKEEPSKLLLICWLSHGRGC